MSLRSSTLRGSLRQIGSTRALSTSARRQAGGHDDHGHGHGHGSGSIGPDDPAAAKNSFFSTPLLASLVGIAGLAYYINYSPSSPTRQTSTSSQQTPAEESTSIFNIYRLLKPYANAELFDKRRLKLVELESDGAYARRLFSQAERPSILESYDTRPDLFASRMKIPVGEELDTTVYFPKRD